MSGWVEIATGAAQIGHELGLWEKLISALRRRKRVLVLGASGAGKTQFINSLENHTSQKLTLLQRTPSVQKRKAKVDGYPFLLFDTPGQLLDEAKRKKAIQEAVRDGVEGIINVVCYGYHEAEEAGGDAAVSKRPNEIAKPTYLRQRRATELDLLAEWVPQMDSHSTSWVLTVVTKADLWWPDENQEIKREYERGDYANALEHLKKIHSVAPYCSVIEPFYGSRNSGRFGDKERAALRSHLLESLVRLTGVTR